MPEGHRSQAALALERAAAQPRHLGRSTSFADENQPRGIEARLALDPGLAALGDIFALLFGRMRCLFLKVIPRHPGKTRSWTAAR
jgi:hypothetical protein